MARIRASSWESPDEQAGLDNGIDIVRYKGGERVETWRQFDLLAFMQQVGVIPAQPRPVSRPVGSEKGIV